MQGSFLLEERPHPLLEIRIVRLADTLCRACKKSFDLLAGCIQVRCRHFISMLTCSVDGNRPRTMY